MKFKDPVMNKEGSLAIEYAILLPILILIILGVLQFALMMFTQATLDEAVSEAAREGSTQYGGYATGQWGTFPQCGATPCANSAYNIIQTRMAAIPGYMQALFSINYVTFVQSPGGPGDEMEYCSYWGMPEFPIIGNLMGPQAPINAFTFTPGYYTVVSCTAVQNENCATLPCVAQ